MRSEFAGALAGETLRLVEAVEAVARDLGVAAYVVGGAVRDWLLGMRAIREVDVAVVGEADEVARELARRVGGALVVFERFGTARVAAFGTYVDIARARSESYARPGALPLPRAAGAIDEDLSRRDFTINAIAVPLSGDARRLVDPWGGQADLQNRRLRALHAGSFVDDPTRLFRGVRLAVRLGLEVDPETARWMQAALDRRAVDTVSAERRGQEVRRALSESPALPVARAFQAWGLWDAACPGWELRPEAEPVLDTIDGHEKVMADLLGRVQRREADGIWNVRLMAVAMPWLGNRRERAERRALLLARRLGLTRALRLSLLRAGAVRDARRRLRRVSRPSTAHRALRALSPVQLVYLAACGGGPGSPDYNWVEWFVNAGRHVRPALTGTDLAVLGCPPGPAVGRLQEALLAAVLDGKARGREEEKAWVVRRMRALAARARRGVEVGNERC